MSFFFFQCGKRRLHEEEAQDGITRNRFTKREQEKEENETCKVCQRIIWVHVWSRLRSNYKSLKAVDTIGETQNNF